MKYSIADIKAVNRKRQAGDVSQLAQSIKEIGLLNPITIQPDGTLIAGLNRLEACKSLGWQEIEVNISELDELHAELAEIDENIARSDLTAIQRAEQLVRRKKIYESLYPETKKGTAQARGMNKALGHNVIPESGLTFVQDTIAKTGAKKSALYEDIQIGEKLKNYTDVLQSTPIADCKSELLSLARLPDEERAPVIAKLVNGQAKSVKIAEKAIKRERVASDLEILGETGTRVLTSGVATQIQPGQTWKLGQHLLYCGDSASSDFIELAKAAQASFAFADPPYNAGVDTWDVNFEWKHDYLATIAPIVAVTPGIEETPHFFARTKMPYKWAMSYWIDNGMTRGALGFGNWIYVALFTEGSLHRNAQDICRVSITSGDGDTLKHKGRKPIEMMLHIIDLFTKPCETVIEPFLGSGTTLIVCEQTQRICIGAEKNIEYCTSIIRRWESQTGKRAELSKASQIIADCA